MSVGYYNINGLRILRLLYFIMISSCLQRKYNPQSKWYTLHSIPRFGRDGLWFFDTIGFSRAGSLTNTLINLTVRSSVGMTAGQLGEKLRCRCHSVLVQLHRHGKLWRIKLGRSHVYLATDPPTQAMQCQAVAGKSFPTAQLPAEVAVFILAEFIRHPEYGFEQLAEVIAHCHRISLAPRQVEELFALHGLKKRCGLRRQNPTGLELLAGTYGAGDIAQGVIPAPAGYPFRSAR